MITAARVYNFKAFKDSGWLPLRQLVCLVGRNSSGKSSLIHALLLFRQSLDERALGATLPQLNLNGRLIESGTYHDIVHHHDSKEQVGFAFRFEIPPRSVEARRAPPLPIIPLDVPQPATRDHLRYRDFLYWRSSGLSRGATGEIGFFFLPEEPFGPTLTRLEITVDGLGAVWFSRTAGRERVQHWRGYASGVPRKSFQIDFPPWSFFPVIVPRLRGKRLRGKAGLDAERFLFVSRAAMALLADFFDGLRMVGPFRTPPSRRFALTSLSGLDVGISGEHATDMLIAETLVRPKDQRLASALSYWLHELHLARKVRIRDVARAASIFELAISGAGAARTANFADVGFGISQIIPVLVQGLLVRRGDYFIVQQPELHLHPDAQAALADYFIYLASHGVRVFVETHSEYLLLRLRRRLAEGVRPSSMGAESTGPSIAPPRSIAARDIAVMCVNDRHGVSTMTELTIGKGFQFDNLPRGFMSQAMEDRLALLKALRKE